MWYKDFSNILTLMAIPAGVTLLVCGPEEYKRDGWLLIAYSIGVTSKTVSGKGKTIKVKGCILALISLCLFTTACIMPMVPYHHGKLIGEVLERHDAYIEADASLMGEDSAWKKDTYLQTSEMIREFLEENAEKESSVMVTDT